jgi:hypothetical protein
MGGQVVAPSSELGWAIELMVQIGRQKSNRRDNFEQLDGWLAIESVHGLAPHPVCWRCLRIGDERNARRITMNAESEAHRNVLNEIAQAEESQTGARRGAWVGAALLVPAVVVPVYYLMTDGLFGEGGPGHPGSGYSTVFGTLDFYKGYWPIGAFGIAILVFSAIRSSNLDDRLRVLRYQAATLQQPNQNPQKP